jgi:hypothetical protein
MSAPQYMYSIHIMRSLIAPRSVRFSLRLRKLSNVGQSLDGRSKMYYLDLLRASKGTLRRARRSVIAEVKHRWSVIGWVTKNLLSQAPPCFGRHVKPVGRLHLQSLAPTNPHWARVVG